MIRMVLPKGTSVDEEGEHRSPGNPSLENGYDSKATGFSGIGGGSRSLGQTGEVLSKKDRLQVGHRWKASEPHLLEPAFQCIRA